MFLKNPNTDFQTFNLYRTLFLKINQMKYILIVIIIYFNIPNF